LEFSSKYLGSKLLVVLGHTDCGAVKAACDNFREGHIGEIINLIRPAVRMEKTTGSQRDSGNGSFVDKVCALNVQVQINEIIHSSDIIQDMLSAKQIGMVGGIYNLSSGEVRFLPETLML
jgi:carbonic anhydrase